MRDTTETTTTRGRYVGPSAARIADLLPQRPDGDGIDVRCKSAGCPRDRITQLLEALSGESIWSAYGPHEASARLVTAGQAATGRPNWRIVLLPVLLLLLAAPVALGYDLQVVALNAFEFGWAGWLVRRILLDRLRLIGGRRRS